jgi:hypothetical protein
MYTSNNCHPDAKARNRIFADFMRRCEVSESSQHLSTGPSGSALDEQSADSNSISAQTTAAR